MTNRFARYASWHKKKLPIPCVFMLVKVDHYFIKHMSTTDAALFAGWQSTGSSLSAQFDLGLDTR